MGKLSHPELPPGALADLVRELHALHVRAGRPSTRELAKGQCFSYTAVHDLFTKTINEAPRLPVLLAVVDRLATMAPRVDVEKTVDRFDALWRAADVEPLAATVEPAVAAVPPQVEVSPDEADSHRLPTCADLEAERQRWEQVNRQLAELQAQFVALAQLETNKSERLDQAGVQLKQLQDEARDLRATVDRRDAELVAERAQNAELKALELELRAQIEQLTIDFATLQRRPHQADPVRQHPPECPDNAPTSVDTATSALPVGRPIPRTLDRAGLQRYRRPSGMPLPPGHPLRRAAVVFVMAALGCSGAAATGGTASPGEPGFPMTRVFFVERARSLEAAQVVAAGLAGPGQPRSAPAGPRR